MGDIHTIMVMIMHAARALGGVDHLEALRVRRRSNKHDTRIKAAHGLDSKVPID